MGTHEPGHNPRRRRWSEPWRVFLSHTSDLRDFPENRSFVAAAEAAVIRAGHAVTDMAYFTARDHAPADYCERMVADASVYAGIVGLRHGTPVRGRPGLSYTELEYEAAARHRLPRLVFMTRDESPSLPTADQPAEQAARQQAFRRRLLEEADVTVAWIATPADLEIGLFQALVELRHGQPTPRYQNRLRLLRGRRFTQEEMAERVGVSLSTYRSWEDGEHRPRAIRALCEALDVQEHELGFGPPSDMETTPSSLLCESSGMGHRGARSLNRPPQSRRARTNGDRCAATWRRMQRTSRAWLPSSIHAR